MRGLIKRREIERVPLDLNLVAGEVVALVRMDAELRRVRLALETGPALPPVQGDRVQLQQVMVNLLLNAMDAMKDNPPANRLVRLRTRHVGPTVEVAVSDNGHGIAADKLPRSSSPSSPPNPTAWVWGWRSPAASSRRTGGDCGRKTTLPVARHSLFAACGGGGRQGGSSEQ